MAAVAAALATGAFVGIARRAQPDFRPIREALPAGRDAVIDGIPRYRREVAGTYLTFPEWYLVFAPQEYARYLHGGRPSGFPYLRLIRQFWSGYAQVYGITRGNYPFNFGKNLMVAVIGTSSTVEFGVKGAYENTVGRLSEWSAGGAATPEDAYAADVATAYGDFVPTEPWFDFPFGHKLAGLWAGVPCFGPHFPRKCERRLFLTLEYGIKSLYAGVIRLASHAVYGVADTEVYASVRQVPEEAWARSAMRKVEPLGGGAWIVGLPHYQGFTDTVPGLANAGVDFDEIAGNREILLTLTAPSAWRYALADGRRLFSMPLLTGPATQRIAVQVPVRALGATLREIRAQGLTVEHLFDY